MKKIKLLFFTAAILNSFICFSQQEKCVTAVCKSTGSHYTANYNTGWALTDRGDGNNLIATTCFDGRNGTIAFTGNQCSFLTAMDGREMRINSAIPVVSNTNWTMDFRLDCNVPAAAIGGLPSNCPGIHLAALTDANNPLFSDPNPFGSGICAGSPGGYPATNMDAIWVNLVGGNIQACGNIDNMNNWTLQAFARDGNNAPLSSGLISLQNGVMNYYVRLQRTNSNAGMLSVFSDPCFATHVAGSPVCFSIPANVTNLGNLSHAVADYGGCSRVFNGTISNLLIDNFVTCTTPLNASFFVQSESPCMPTYAPSLVVNGSASSGAPPILYHYWEVYPVDGFGVPIAGETPWSSWYSGAPGVFSAFPPQVLNWITYPKQYRLHIKLAVQSCGNVWATTSNIATCATWKPLGINENNEQKYFSLFPNPNSGKFIINVPTEYEKSSKFEMYSLDGKMVFSENLSLNTGLVELNIKLESGIYFAKIVSEDGKKSCFQKMVIHN